MSEIKRILSHDLKENFWEEDPLCFGFTVSDKDCPLRFNEMRLVSYVPIECLDGTLKNCDKLVAYARFDIRN